MIWLKGLKGSRVKLHFQADISDINGRLGLQLFLTKNDLIIYLASSFIFLDALRAALAFGSVGALEGRDEGSFASCSFKKKIKKKIPLSINRFIERFAKERLNILIFSGNFLSHSPN